MKVKLWGTRGSIATPGPETTRYGGNTSCVQVSGSAGTVLVLDAGTGIRQLGMTLPRDLRRARKFLNVYLDSAKTVTENYAATSAKAHSPEMEAKFRSVLDGGVMRISIVEPPPSSLCRNAIRYF